MATWQQIVKQIQGMSESYRRAWLGNEFQQHLEKIAEQRNDNNVLLYGSSFLQKPQAPPQRIQITAEDINGMMSVIHGMDWNKPLTLVLHTPGGVINATESLVEYIRSKFAHIEVIVPTFAMSAGTMIALASDLIIMGRHSQLGPIDPQMPYPGRFVSARAVVDQFHIAKQEILNDNSSAHVWAPILASLGPSLIQEAQNALAYGENMVKGWLEKYMFSSIEEQDERSDKAKQVAKYFNDTKEHKSHGRRIDRDEARGVGVFVENMEDDQGLQDIVLTAYHLMTIMFEQSTSTKIIWSNHGQQWVRNWQEQPLVSS